jgi:prepilin-type N-terminal cleavage/methylation domain-containing protein/prepilin-type processing-associated H-X9-DG protein
MLPTESQLRRPSRQRFGFTLVELLVVIGIIAILISVLLPVLGSARKAGYKAKCLANLKTLGDAYKMYQLDNKGYWPAAWNTWAAPNNPTGKGDKRWHDYIGKYVVGGMVGKQEINFNGTQTASKEPQIWTEPIWHSDNAIWGCPMWERVRRDANGNNLGVDDLNGVFFPGYQQNWYPMTPKSSVTCVNFNTDPPPGGYQPRGFFKYTQWNRQAERALVFESVSHNRAPGSANWPFAPEGATAWPKTANLNFGIDFNRHGKYKVGNKWTDSTLNMLYCDGHATTVSAREAWKAIRFN